jgi:hypothetical protein
MNKLIVSHFRYFTFLVLEEHLSDANESLRKKEEELSALQHKFEVTEQKYVDANKRIGGMKSYAHIRFICMKINIFSL